MNGHLFEPANLQQNDNTADHALSLVGEKWLWFGITDAETEGQWETASTKTTIPFENWNPGEPNNHMGNQECGKMKVSVNMVVEFHRRTLKFNAFLHPNEYPERIFWYRL